MAKRKRTAGTNGSRRSKRTQQFIDRYRSRIPYRVRSILDQVDAQSIGRRGTENVSLDFLRIPDCLTWPALKSKGNSEEGAGVGAYYGRMVRNANGEAESTAMWMTEAEMARKLEWEKRRFDRMPSGPVATSTIPSFRRGRQRRIRAQHFEESAMSLHDRCYEIYVAEGSNDVVGVNRYLRNITGHGQPHSRAGGIGGHRPLGCQLALLQPGARKGPR